MIDCPKNSISVIIYASLFIIFPVFALICLLLVSLDQLDPVNRLLLRHINNLNDILAITPRPFEAVITQMGEPGARAR